MREIRLSGSEGGAELILRPYPYPAGETPARQSFMTAMLKRFSPFAHHPSGGAS